jgi:hypothetical protein
MTGSGRVNNPRCINFVAWSRKLSASFNLANFADPVNVELTFGFVSREYPRDDGLLFDEVADVTAGGDEGLLRGDGTAGLLVLVVMPPPFFFSAPPNKASRLASFSRLCLGPVVDVVLFFGGPNRASRLMSLFIRLELLIVAKMREAQPSARVTPKKFDTGYESCLRNTASHVIPKSGTDITNTNPTILTQILRYLEMIMYRTKPGLTVLNRNGF